VDIYLSVHAEVFAQIDVLPIAEKPQIVGDLFLAFLSRDFCLNVF